MRTIKLFSICLIISLVWITNATAQEYGLELLTIGPNTQALGLNEAVTAELLGASSLYTNPANLAFENSSGLNADYTLWIGGLNNTHAAINLRKNSRALAFGFIGSQTDDIPLRNNGPGPPDGSFAVSFVSLNGGYAYRFGSFSIGGTIQYLREEYYIHTAAGLATNFGASAQLFDDRLNLGTSLLNLGKMTELRNEPTPLPTTFRAGINAELLTFDPPENDDLPITAFLKSDLVIPLKATSSTTQSDPTKEIYSNIALAFDVADIIALRVGYKTGDTARSWSTGAGITVGAISANYAMIPFDTGFGTVHSVGISYQF